MFMTGAICPQCGNPIPGDAPIGQCPVCILALATELDPSFKKPHRQFGDYVLGQQLGSGAMGIVYEAHQVSLNRTVALKFLRNAQVASATLLRRFTIEAEAAARLQHPNIVALFEIGEVEGQPFFSMDLVAGESLRERIGKGDFRLRATDTDKSVLRGRQMQVARLIATTARALHHAHQRGVLHRDLKPANILMDHEDEPHLSDFGLAKILRVATDMDTRQSLTGTGDIAGTPSYMSPEQAAGGEVTCVSDVYGLGAVLYEMLTGRPPFRGNTALETLKQVQEHQVRSPRAIQRGVEKDLETICVKCLEKDPRRRYSSAEALAEDLENWIQAKPICARPAGLVHRSAQWVKRNPTGTALIATLFLGLTAALVLLHVVNQQKIRSDIQQAVLFREKVDQLSRHWADTNQTELVIFSKDLAILGNRAPRAELATRTLSLGVRIPGDPVSYAQQQAPLFARLEEGISEALGETVQLDLVLFKRHLPEWDLMARARADIMVIEATSYLEAKKRVPGVVPVAQANRRESIVVVARADSGLRNLSQLSGKSVAFPDFSDPVTIFFKARLVEAGILGKDLKTMESPILSEMGRVYHRAISRENVAAVLRGKVDAAATHVRRYEHEKHNGLHVLDSFESIPGIIVVRQGFDNKLSSAFRIALARLGQGSFATQTGDGGRHEWEITLTETVAMSDPDLNRLRAAMRKAAIFDGQPDPFPPDSQAAR
jgi:serine/threonine protein kinase/ABC-type phosphate/phosphonate transport system substrate-binding protein